MKASIIDRNVPLTTGRLVCSRFHLHVAHDLIYFESDSPTNTLHANTGYEPATVPDVVYVETTFV